MRTIIVSLTTAGLLFIIFFQSFQGTRAELILSAAQVAAQASPTPPKLQAKEIEPVPTPPLTTGIQANNQQQELTEAEKLRRKGTQLLQLDLPLDEIGTPPNWYDPDLDKVHTLNDNCWLVSNPDQKDSDGDGVGDVCDPDLVDVRLLDWDGDGISDEKDNCPRVCNFNQKDSNENGIGNACDSGSNRYVEPCKRRRALKQLRLP